LIRTLLILKKPNLFYLIIVYYFKLFKYVRRKSLVWLLLGVVAGWLAGLVISGGGFVSLAT
jgi:hypothetical protein